MDLRGMQADYQRVTEEKLVVGALVETDLSEEEGLVLKNGRTSKLKKIIVIGYDRTTQCCYGSVLINSKMNPRSDYSDEFLEAQYQLVPDDYSNFLRYPSYVDCAKVFSFPLNKLLAGKYYGCLNDVDKKGVLDILETTDTLSTKEKKRFGIRRR